VHATVGQAHDSCRVPATVGRVRRTVGRVPVTVGRRRGEIAKEYHICLTPYSVEPSTSDMFHKWIR
jgi:hypothetical protein